MENESNVIGSNIIKWVNEIIDKAKIGDFPENYASDRVMYERMGEKYTDYERAVKSNNQKEIAHSKECMRHYALALGLAENKHG